jgi:hypothetical protein
MADALYCENRTHTKIHCVGKIQRFNVEAGGTYAVFIIVVSGVNTEHQLSAFKPVATI